MTAVAWPAQMSLALALAEEADAPANWPGLGRRDPGPLRIIVVPHAAAMRRFTGGVVPSWGAGAALPASRTIIIRADGGDPFQTLRHELAHLALRRAVRTRVPRWFQEGYASYASGEWSRLDALTLNLAVLRGQVPELADLDSTLRGAEGGASVSYALATSAVFDLARRHPEGSLAPILGLLEDGVSWSDAVRRTTGLNVGQFERAWRHDVRRRYTALTWLAAGGFWLLIAGTVLLAGAIRRRQDAPRRRALDVGWELPPEEDTGQLDHPSSRE